MKIELRVRHIGPVPAFKNSKRAILCNGKMRTLTQPEAKKWMQDCVESFVLQLLWTIQTTGEEMPMEPSPLSLIVSSMPEDDCWECIPEINISCRLVLKGEEGATITIEEI